MTLGAFRLSSHSSTVQHLLLQIMLHVRYAVDMSTSTLSRKSVPVDAEMSTFTRDIRTPGTPAREAVEALVGPLPDHLSEAQALSTLLNVARDKVKETANASGYAAYAATLNEEDRAAADHGRKRRHERARRRAEAGTE